jgi:hypothetical protein
MKQRAARPYAELVKLFPELAQFDYPAYAEVERSNVTHESGSTAARVDLYVGSLWLGLDGLGRGLIAKVTDVADGIVRASYKGSSAVSGCKFPIESFLRKYRYIGPADGGAHE